MESDAKQSDAFFRFTTWADAHRKQLIIGTAAVLILGLVAYWFNAMRKQKEAAADAALSKIAAGQIGVMNPGTIGADTFLAVARQHPGTDAEVRALILGATALFSEGNYAEALAQFEKFTRDHSQSAFLDQAMLGVAASQRALGKTNEAIAAYQRVTERFPKSAVTPQAKFALGTLYNAGGKYEQARNLFEDVAREDPFGSLGSEAGMRSEEILKLHPELAPKPVLPTNAVPTLSASVPTPPAITNAPSTNPPHAAR